MVFTISGWATVRSASDEVFLRAGSVLVIPAGMECRGFPAGYVRTVTLYFHTEYLSDQVRWLSVVHPLVHYLQRALDDDSELHQLQLASSAMHGITPALVRLTHSTAVPRRDFVTMSIASELFDAVGKLCGVASGSIDVERKLPRREIVIAIALLRSNLAHRWTVEELAREIAVSASHLTRLFRSDVGLSPAAFLRQLRADQMAELLATRNVTVGEAGAMVGWNDATLATRSFKHRYGASPRAYTVARRRALMDSPDLSRPRF
ncbi:MAG: helix-turn-helix transcriptional regulator [Micrococcaceae bacterium]